MKNNNKGFSLVELIVVIAIMAILAAIAIPTFAHFITKANEASDAELLHNINYIFNAACVENGVDIKDVTSATWNKTDKKIENVKINGVANDTTAKIEASFILHFGEMKNEEFKLIEDIYFNSTLHEFVEGSGFFYVTEDGKTYYYVADADKVNAFSNSIFANDQMGVEKTLQIMDNVGLFAQEFLMTGESTALTTVLQSVEFAKAFAEYVSYPNAVNNADDVAAFYSWMEIQYPDQEDRSLVTSNALMLYSSKKSGAMTTESVKNLLGDTENNAKDQILANLSGETPDTATAMAQTAAAYGLYTAYLHSLPDGYVDNGKTKAQLIEEAQTNPISVLNGLDDAGFQQYINDPANSKDIDGYLAAMGMMNEASGTSNGQGGTAAGDILTEGFNTDWMQGMLEQATGN